MYVFKIMEACPTTTLKGKGNIGKCIERVTKVCAAGKPIPMSEPKMKDYLQHYLLQDEVDALVHDALVPLSTPPYERQPPPDKRNAGLNTDVRELINPQPKTKFQCLVEEIKSTVYSSYWNKAIGFVPDATPKLPKGMDVLNTTFGKPTPRDDSLYDIVFPTNAPEQNTSPRRTGTETKRDYCRPAYDPTITYGRRTNQDPRGRSVKSILTYDKILDGRDLAVPMSSRQADYKESRDNTLGRAQTSINNIDYVPKDFTFGIITTTDKQNDHFFKCLGALKKLRKRLSTLLDNSSFSKFYLQLKYLDKCKTGWLPKELVYEKCSFNYIHFDANLIEAMLSMWDAFDGSKIDYKKFVAIINHSEPLPKLSKLWNSQEERIDFKTTYREMVKPGQEIDMRGRAGLPSGRYFDMDYPITPENYCRAARAYLPQESDVKSCLLPSILSNIGVTHRDMYAIREPQIVRRVFEASGEKFTDETFDAIWKEATKYHPKGYVCYETFRKALDVVKVSGDEKNRDKI